MALRVPVSLQEDTSRSYAFIDGEYLRNNFSKQMEQIYGHVPPLDFAAIGNKLAGSRTYSYDAVNYQQGKEEEQAAFEERVARRESEHRYINSLPGVHVRNGFIRRGEKRKNEQKAVDVQLAVD